ncbi:MAG: pyridoxamine 5'-phosphate oxidase family protein [Chloroflexota bacterium]
MTSNKDVVLQHTTARGMTKLEIDNFLSKPIIARLATVGNNLQPHVVPVWYLWKDESLWITLDQTSKKYKNLLSNPRCAVTIDESLGGLRFMAVIMEGEAEIITGPKVAVLNQVIEIYTRYLGKEAVLCHTPQQMLTNGQHALLKLKPEKIISWDDTHGVAPVG